MSLDKNAKIYIAGHRGLVGSAIWNNLKTRGYNNLVGRTHRELDLTDQFAVRKFFGCSCCRIRGRHHGKLTLSCRLHND